MICPTRDPMVPEEGTFSLRRLAESSCPPGQYQECCRMEACEADKTLGVTIACWEEWLSAYAAQPTDGQEWHCENGPLLSTVPMYGDDEGDDDNA